MSDIDEIKRRLRELRVKFELTQQEMAGVAGMDYKFYQHIESPRKKQMWVDTVARLAAVYGLELWQFFHPDYLDFAKRPRTKRTR